MRKSSNVDSLRNSGLNLELAIGNLNDQYFIDQVMKDVKTVLHIYNIHNSIDILQASIAHNVERAILVHTTGIYSDFKSASSEYKRIESEVIAMAKDKISLTILRPSMIYGDMCDRNMSKFIKMIDSMRIVPVIAGGKCVIQPVNARDLGRAYYDVLTHPEITRNKQYDLTGDKPISMKDVLVTIGKDLTKDTIYISIPMQRSMCAAYLLKFLTFGKVDIVEKVLRMGEDRAFSHDLAKQDFNYTPMSFEEGIQNEIKQFKLYKQLK